MNIEMKLGASLRGGGEFFILTSGATVSFS
jgi:hypothetical protein